MKIRFTHTGIRIRFDQNDMSAFKVNQEVTFKMQISLEATFSCHIFRINEQEASLDWQGKKLQIGIPASDLNKWINSDDEGIYFKLDIGKTALKIAIEKDYGCKHPGRNPQEDKYAFKNPNE